MDDPISAFRGMCLAAFIGGLILAAVWIVARAIW